MEVCLDGVERTAGLAGDLVEAQLPEEPQRDDLPVRLGEHGDRGADVRRPFRADDER